MKTVKSNHDNINALCSFCEYKLVVIAKSATESLYGISAQDASEVNMCIKEISADKELALSIIDILNSYKVPFVHFQDVIDDLMNE